MRAVAVRKFRGTPELMDLPKPSPGPGEILVDLTAAGVNPFDWKIVDGLYEGKRPHVFPLIAGVDGAGVVESTGDGVRRFKVGDPVYGQFLHDPVGRGTYAEYVAAPETLGIGLVPRGIDSAQAAAVPTAGMMAVDALDTLGLSRGQTLLLIGAAGGIGSFVTQLASSHGILVIAVTKGDNGTYLRKLGATEVHDSRRTDYLEGIRFGHPAGVDAMIDFVIDDPLLGKHAELVKEGGTVSSTTYGIDPALAAPRRQTAVNFDLHPRPELIDRLSAEISAGRLRVPVERQLPLSDGPKALAAVREGTSRGKTILNIF